jgi:hypothetical protein
MVDVNFSKVKDAPLNRDGETSESSFTGMEGDTIGFSTDVDGNPILVHADADNASPQPAMGVLMEDVRARSDWNVTMPNDHSGTWTRRLDERYEERMTQPGDEVTYFTHGIYLTDDDGGRGWAVNEPIYLAVGGGFTQTKPSSTGDIVQVLGVAVDENTFLLDVDFDYTTSA